MEGTEERISYPDPRYPTLQHAVDALTPGGQLIVQEGEHTAGVTITKNIHLASRVGSTATLRAPSGCPVVSLVNGAELLLQGLILSGSSLGVAANANSRTTIRACTLATGSGIELLYWTQATISDCTISGGITLGDLAQATITDCTISESKSDGIRLEDLSQAAFTGCKILGSQKCGIWLQDLAQAAIADCAVSDNKGEGISLGDWSQATVTGCTVSGNDFGIELMGYAEATMTGCAVSQNKGEGISLADWSQATVTECTVSGNDYGIVFRDSSWATIARCSVSSNVWVGVVLHEHPCFTDEEFAGYVAGGGNVIPGRGEDGGNGARAVCPDALGFLMTEEGGELDRRPAP
jgi:parallel beta-helix repeat protein